jgi:hypothetical protein
MPKPFKQAWGLVIKKPSSSAERFLVGKGTAVLNLLIDIESVVSF